MSRFVGQAVARHTVIPQSLSCAESAQFTVHLVSVLPSPNRLMGTIFLYMRRGASVALNLPYPFAILLNLSEPTDLVHLAENIFKENSLWPALSGR